MWQPLGMDIADNGAPPPQIVAFLVGYVLQNIHYTLWIGLAGGLLTLLIVVPPWPIYNRHPEKWLPPKNQLGGLTIEVDKKGQ